MRARRIAKGAEEFPTRSAPFMTICAHCVKNPAYLALLLGDLAVQFAAAPTAPKVCESDSATTRPYTTRLTTGLPAKWFFMFSINMPTAAAMPS